LSYKKSDGNALIGCRGLNQTTNFWGKVGLRQKGRLGISLEPCLGNTLNTDVLNPDSGVMGEEQVENLIELGTTVVVVGGGEITFINGDPIR
jgi:hypothetical protein